MTITKFNRRFELSEETTLILQEDGGAILEVLYQDDLAMVALTPQEVRILRDVLRENEQAK